jgi:hypothetical protein
LKNAFQITENGKQLSHVFCATSLQEKQDWLTAINKAIAEAQKKKGNLIKQITHIYLFISAVFGVPLNDLMRNPIQGVGRSIPLIVEQILNYLEMHGISIDIDYFLGNFYCRN